MLRTPLSKCLSLECLACLLAVAFMAPSAVYCADASTTTANTAQNAGASTTTVTTEQKLERIREQLPEIKMQEAVIHVSPKMKIYLPSGAFDLSLKQNYRKTSMELTTKYDFVDSFMGFGMDFGYDLLPYTLGLTFADTVDFNEIYSGTEYIQRSQSVTPYVLRPVSKHIKMRTGLKFENTYTDAISSNFVLDRGKNILGDIGAFSDTITESTSAPSGGSALLSLMHSFQNLGSDYNYTQGEFNLKRYFGAFGQHYVELDAQAGYPLEVSNRPFNSFYQIGGYKILRGYQFKEFIGDSLLYGSVKYHIPLNNPREEDYFKHFTVSMFTWNFFMEAAKIGTKDIFTTPADAKFSAGTGIGYKIVLFRLFPVKLELSAAKAVEDRPVYYYFTISTIWYTWRGY